MKRLLYLTCIFALLSLYVSAQDNIVKFYFSGYKVVVVPCDHFSVEVKNPELGTHEIKGNTMRWIIKDQNGRVPKDTIIIHTNKIEFLSVHNAELAVNELFVTDSLSINASSSYGNLNIKADYLKLNLVAGSRLQVSGEAETLVAAVKAGSTLNSKLLVADTANAVATGNSFVSVNAKNLLPLDKEYSNVTNVWEP